MASKRVTLRFHTENEAENRLLESLVSLKRHQSRFVITAIQEYMENHPQWYGETMGAAGNAQEDVQVKPENPVGQQQGSQTVGFGRQAVPAKTAVPGTMQAQPDSSPAPAGSQSNGNKELIREGLKAFGSGK